jgi:hypothetical protein
MVYCESIALHICCEFMYTGEGDVAPSLSFLCIWNERVYCLPACVHSGWSNGGINTMLCSSGINTSYDMCRIVSAL